MASLLESFFILFETDAEDVKKGAEEAGEATDELEDRIKKTDKATEELGKSFNKLANSAKRSLLATVSAGAILAGTLNALRQTDEIGKFSDALGFNAAEIDAWGQAVIRNGGTAEGFRSSIAGLTTQLADFALTGGGQIAETFALLGISAFDAQGKIKPSLDILLDVADVFQNLSEQQAFNFGQKLGLDQGTILLLQQGRRDVNDLIRQQKELGVITNQDKEAAEAFNIALADTLQSLRPLFLFIGAHGLVLFNRLADSIRSITNLFLEHKEAVVTFFIAAATAITAIYLPVIKKAAISTLLTIGPYLLMAAVVAVLAGAIALLVDDIIAYTRGQDSLIGVLEKSSPAFKRMLDFIKSLKNAFSSTDGALDTLLKALRLIPNFLGLIFPPLRLFSTLLDQISLDEIKFDSLTDEFKSLLGVLESIFPPLKLLTTLIDKLGGEGVDFDLSGLLNKAKASIGLAESSPLAAQNSNVINNARTTSNRNTHVSVGNVNVDAQGSNANELSRNVGSALKDQIQLSINDFDNGLTA